jgi:GNAT superfamily N-acetyltransferase
LRDALITRRLTIENWNDVVRVLGPTGGDKGCWCQWWNWLPREFDAMTPGARRDALHADVRRGQIVGIIGYVGDVPIGWCAVSPGVQSLPRRQRSRAWRSPDDAEVWSITCFYLVADQRGHDLARELLAGAEDLARSEGALWLEAYPRDCMGSQLTDRAMFFGSLGMFLDAGFTEQARRLPEFPVVRKELRPS